MRKKLTNMLGKERLAIPLFIRYVSFFSAVVFATAYVAYTAVGANTTIGNNITSSGSLTIGGTGLFSGSLRASSTVQVTGTTTLFGALVSTSNSTSTFANGFDISGGCLAINGTCLTTGGGGGGGSGTVSSSTQGQVAFYNANGTTVSGTSTITITSAGNVGVGTSTASRLTVFDVGNRFGPGSGPDNIQVVDLTTPLTNAQPSISFKTVNREWSVGNRGDLNESFAIREVGVDDHFVINASGNIGIGSTTPSTRFAVQGNGLFSGDLNLANLTATGTLTVQGTGTSTFAGGLQASLLNITSSSASSTFANGIQLSAGCFRDASGSCVGGGGVTGSGSSGQATFWTGASAISGDNNFIWDNTNKKLGIGGTTTPSQKLTLVEGNFLHTSGGTISALGGIDVGVTVDAVQVVGRFAYIGVEGVSGTCSGSTLTGCEFRIYDISNPTNPVALGGYDTFGRAIKSLYVVGKRTYVGTTAAGGSCVDTDISGCEFFILDTSNPTSIQARSGVDIPGTTVNSVYVSGQYAYIGHDAVSGNDFRVIDISNPTSPVTVGGLDIGFNVNAVYVQGQYAYIANSNNAAGNEFQVISVEQPSSPAVSGGVDIGTFAFGVYVSGRYAFVGNDSISGTCSGTTLTGCEFRIYDISSGTPVAVGGLDTTFGMGRFSPLFVSGKYAYIGLLTDSGSANDFRIIDISNPSVPTSVGGTNIGQTVVDIFVAGKYAYLGVSSVSGNDFQILDISGIDVPTASVGSVSAGYITVQDNATINNNLYVRNGVNIGTGGINSEGPITVMTSGTGGLGNLSAFEVRNGAAGILFRIRDGGNVGVGTTTPGSLLSVAGGLSVGSNFGATAPSNGAIIEGNVGIGTTSPSQTLAVHGNGLFSGNLSLANLVATGTIGVGTSTPSESFATAGRLYVGGTGTSTIENNFKIIGNLQLGSGTSIFRDTATSSLASGINLSSGCFSINGTCVGAGGGGGSGTVNAGTTGQLPYYAADGTTLTATSTLFLTSASKIGIGTTSPLEKLTVAGNLSNISDSNFTPTIKGTLSIPTFPNHVFVSGNYAYISDQSGNLKIVDVSNPTTPTLRSTLDLGTNTQELYVSGRYAYVVDNDSDSLRVIDVSNAAVPYVVSTTTIGSWPNNVQVSGRYAYVVDQADLNLRIMDVSNPAKPATVSIISLGASPTDLYVYKNYAYIAESTTFRIIDISDPKRPLTVGTLSSLGTGFSVNVSGRYAYLYETSGSGLLRIIDISNPASPSAVSTIALGSNNREIFVTGRYVYAVGVGTDDIKVVDVASSTAPFIVSSVNIGTFPEDVYVSGRYAYVVDDDTNRLSIIDITGFETTSAIVHSLESGNLQVRNDVLIQGQLQANSGLTVGSGGILSSGSLAISATTSQSSILGGLFIGTTTPATTSPNFSQFASSVMVVEATSSSAIPLTIRGAGTQTGNYFQIQNSANTNQLVFNSSGQLGIGTTSSSQLLSVHGNALFSGDLNLANLTATGTLTVQGTGTSTFIGGLQANLLNITSSTATSTFANGLNISSGCFAINGTCVTGGGGGGSGTVNNGTQGQVAFYDSTGTAVSGTSTIFITSAQNVGVGTSSPAEKLAVAGRLYVGGSGTSTIENNLKVQGNLQVGSGSITLTSDSILSGGAVRFGGSLVSNSSPVSSSTSQMITSVVASGYGSGGNDLHDIAIGIDGLPLIAEQESGSLKVIHCGNASCTSGNVKTTVDSSAADIGRAASIAIGVDGLPIISYHDLTNGDLEVVKCGNIECSSGNTITTVDSSGDVGRGTSIAIGADGLPVISYGDVSNLDLKVVKCGNHSCSSGNTITTVDGALASLGLENSIAIGTDGLPIISYYDITNTDLKVAKCGNAACSSGNTLTTVDTSDSRYNRIAIAGDGLPVISYSVGSTLRMMKCGNISCSAGNTTTDVDTTAASGARTFIAVGTDGLPILAYQDTANDFSVAKCNNATCSANTQTVIEAGDSSLLGQFPKIAIGVDSLPIVAYGGNSSGVLRVVTCANASCSSTSGTSFTGGQTLGGWMATPRSFSPPFQAVNTLKIVNPIMHQNLSLFSGGVERLTITSVGRVGIGTTSPISAFSIHNPAASVAPTSTTTLAAINLVQDVTGEEPVWAQFGLNGIDANGTQMPAWIGTQVTDSFSIMTASRERLKVTSSGNVGIGTTSPMDKLSVANGNIAVSGCVRDAETGTVHAGSCLDLAETYEVGEYVTAGDILVVNHEGKLVKATAETKDKLIGVVSTAPAVVLEGTTAYFGGSRYRATTTYEANSKAPIALAGRVPVKVNNEGGALKSGDPITISSISGIGKKAQAGDKIIGYAISDADQNNNVLVFVSLGYYQSANTSMTSSLLAQVVDTVRSWLESMQIFIENGLVRLKALKAEKVITDGIEMKDKATGEVYCVSITNGEFVKTSGECPTSSTPSSPTSTPTPDTTPPTITMHGPSTVELEKGTQWSDPGATVTDDTNPNIGLTYMVNNTPTSNEGRDLPTIDTNIPGTYTITYIAQDEAGNTSQSERTVIVREATSGQS